MSARPPGWSIFGIEPDDFIDIIQPLEELKDLKAVTEDKIKSPCGRNPSVVERRHVFIVAFSKFQGHTKAEGYRESSTKVQPPSKFTLAYR